MALDAVARRYGQRPSSILGLNPRDPVAYVVDIHTAKTGREHDPPELVEVLEGIAKHLKG